MQSISYLMIISKLGTYLFVLCAKGYKDILFKQEVGSPNKMQARSLSGFNDISNYNN